MIDPTAFLVALGEAGVTFATGVPDSLLKDVCACISAGFSPECHVAATSEGSAVALAMGNFLATGRPALVYMQNSGLGNLINPVTSLADPLVYGIPMLLLIGWRGEIQADGIQLHDEPQHVKQGQVTVAQLDILGIPYRLLDESTNDVQAITKELTHLAIARSGPVALLVRKHAFCPFKFDLKPENLLLPTRETAIKIVIGALPENTPVVSTTGMASRELFELRKARGEGHDQDFLTVGGMGHASQIATGIALACPDQKVVCLDGDGAMLMHMGGLVVSGKQRNIIHVVINNGAHDSVGGQPTSAVNLDLAHVARACGYGLVAQATTEQEIQANLHIAIASNCSAFLEIKCRRGARADLGRPDRSPSANKEGFMLSLKRILGE
jgi:phosphonopyruvate decarboxylase